MKDIELFNDQNEQWKSIPNFDNYEASNYGRIRSIDRDITQLRCKRQYTRKMKGRIIKPRIQNNGYLIVWLRREGVTKAISVHRLVATTFLQSQNADFEINHKDGNKTNNAISNLEWVSRSENIKHSYKELNRPKNMRSVLCVETNIEYDSIQEAAIKTNTNSASIGHVLAGRNKTAGGYTWKRLD